MRHGVLRARVEQKSSTRWQRKRHRGSPDPGGITEDATGQVEHEKALGNVQQGEAQLIDGRLLQRPGDRYRGDVKNRACDADVERRFLNRGSHGLSPERRSHWIAPMTVHALITRPAQKADAYAYQGRG